VVLTQDMRLSCGLHLCSSCAQVRTLSNHSAVAAVAPAVNNCRALCSCSRVEARTCAACMSYGMHRVMLGPVIPKIVAARSAVQRRTMHTDADFGTRRVIGIAQLSNTPSGCTCQFSSCSLWARHTSKLIAIVFLMRSAHVFTIVSVAVALVLLPL